SSSTDRDTRNDNSARSLGDPDFRERIREGLVHHPWIRRRADNQAVENACEVKVSENGSNLRVQRHLVNALRDSPNDLRGRFHQDRGTQLGTINGPPLPLLSKAFVLETDDAHPKRLEDEVDDHLPVKRAQKLPVRADVIDHLAHLRASL